MRDERAGFAQGSEHAVEIVQRSGHPCLLEPEQDPVDGGLRLDQKDLLQAPERRDRIRELVAVDENSGQRKMGVKRSPADAPPTNRAHLPAELGVLGAQALEFNLLVLAAPVALLLIILGCILAPVAVLGVWAGNEVSNTGRYVATVEPLVHDPAMQNYLTDQITNQITSRINITGIMNQGAAQLNNRGLPKIGSLLTQFGPQIASSVTGFIHSTVHSVVTTQAFATAWVQVNTVAHQALVQILSGQNGGTISTSNGQIVLNLGPLIAVAKQDLVAHGFKLASSIPPVTPTLALFQAKDLGKAQSQYRLIKALKIVLPILALVLIAAGVYVARSCRHALVGAGLGLAASMLVLAIGLEIFRSIYLSSIPSNVLPTDAAAAVWDALVHFIKQGLRVVLVVGLVVAIGAFFTGPSHTAVRTRLALSSGMDWIRHYGERRGVSTGPAGQWTYVHRRSLRVGTVALFALIFAFWAQPTAIVVIVLVILLLVVLGLIELIGRPPAEPHAAGQAVP